MAAKKIKLLILDDEKDICKFVKLIFRKKGVLVYSALSGNQAIRLIKKVRPHIALLDIYLKKGMDGLRTLSKIRQIMPKCRCIMVTWDKAKNKIREAKNLGASSYLTKPLTVKQLLKVVMQTVRNIRKRG